MTISSNLHNPQPFTINREEPALAYAFVNNSGFSAGTTGIFFHVDSVPKSREFDQRARCPPIAPRKPVSCPKDIFRCSFTRICLLFAIPSTRTSSKKIGFLKQSLNPTSLCGKYLRVWGGTVRPSRSLCH